MTKFIVIGLILILLFSGCTNSIDEKRYKTFCNDSNGKFVRTSINYYCYLNGIEYYIKETQDGLTLYVESPATKGDAFVGGMVGGMIGGLFTGGSSND